MHIRMLAVLLPLALSGCAVRLASGPVPLHVHSSPQAMQYDEAVSMGGSTCQSRGYNCQLKEAHLTGKDIWKVKYRVARGSATGHLHLEFHAITRELVKVKEKVKEHGHGHDHD